MSKKKNQTMESIPIESVEIEVPVQPMEEKHEIPPPLPEVGDDVHFNMAVQNSNGSTTIQAQAAQIVGLNPPGNFQRDDWAVSLYIIPGKVGSNPGYRHGVLFSKEPRDGRWSYRKNRGI